MSGEKLQWAYHLLAHSPKQDVSPLAMWGHQDSLAKLVYNSDNYGLWYTYNYSYWGESKPTNITEGPHIGETQGKHKGETCPTALNPFWILARQT